MEYFVRICSAFIACKVAGHRWSTCSGQNLSVMMIQSCNVQSCDFSARWLPDLQVILLGRGRADATTSYVNRRTLLLLAVITSLGEISYYDKDGA